jgi:disulfide bond formation protein DsbB
LEAVVTRTGYVLAASGGSFGLLAGAYVFQYLGYPPCELCWFQRYPHFVAVAIGVMALLIRGPVLPILGALAAATTAGIGVYHSGVERHWWAGPSACTGGGLGGMSGSDLLSVDGPQIVMCDQISWQVLGLSMANWNVIFSIVLIFIWVRAARAPSTRVSVTRAA